MWGSLETMIIISSAMAHFSRLLVILHLPLTTRNNDILKRSFRIVRIHAKRFSSPILSRRNTVIFLKRLDALAVKIDTNPTALTQSLVTAG